MATFTITGPAYSAVEELSFTLDPFQFFVEPYDVYEIVQGNLLINLFGVFSFSPEESWASIYRVVIEDTSNGETILFLDGAAGGGITTQGVDYSGDEVFDAVIKTATTGTDTMNGGTAADTLNAFEGNDFIYGNVGNDTLIGGKGSDQLSGGAGDDTLAGGIMGVYHGLVTDDSDTIDGGEGLDAAYYRFAFLSANVVLDGATGAIKIVDTLSTDTLTNVEMIQFNRYIANQSIQGPTRFILMHVGNEFAGTFSEAVNLQRLLAANVGILAFHTVVETVNTDGLTLWADLRGGGNDMLTTTGGNDRIAAGDGADQITSGDGIDTLYGDAGHDALSGEADDDTILGGTGDDAIMGGADDDRLYGEDGKDNIVGGVGNDRAYGGAADDRLGGDAGSDILLGDAGNDRLNGGDHNDRLYGGDGDDIILGGIGNDTLYGEAGADRLYTGDGNDIALGGAGGDSIYGEAGSDWLYGGADGDTILGGAGNDQIFGEDGADRLLGEDGNDRLMGGPGNDVHMGGLGADKFIFTDDNQGNDRIDDWVAVDDQLEIDASAFGAGLAAGPLAANRLVIGAAPVAHEAFGQFLYNTANGQLSWDMDGTGSGAAVAVTRLLNAGVAAATLAVGDFDIVA